MYVMRSLVRLAMRHRGVVTVTLLAGLLLNLVVIGQVDPPKMEAGSLTSVARCQGGGAGCAEQPLIPPPAIGMPRFDPQPGIVFGALILVAVAALVAMRPASPPTLEHPPRALAFA
jgi:hypothetical protein